VRGDLPRNPMADFDAGLAQIPDPFAHRAHDTLPPPASRPRFASPSRSRRRAFTMAAACAAVVYELAGLAFFKTRHDLGTASVALVALEIALPLGVAVVALVAASRSGRLGLGEPTARLAAWVIGAPFIFAVATLVIFPREASDGAFWSRTTTCILVTALLGAGPLMLAAFALRNAFAAATGWRTAAVGVVCGALAAATIALVCPDGGALHVLIGHGAMMLVMGALAAGLIGRTARI
jgi:hypothetical protein